MKLTLPVQSLQAAFQAVGNAVPSRTPCDILKNVKLTVSDTHPVLSANDGEMGVRYQMVEEVEPTGEALLLPAQRFSAILKEVTAPAVTLEMDDSTLVVTAGKSVFRLPTEAASDFPDMEVDLNAEGLTVATEGLREAIKRVVFACEPDGLKYALAGAQLELSGEKAVLAATDSRRLAVGLLSKPAVESEAEPLKGILPRKTLQLLARVLSEPEVHVGLSGSNWTFLSGPIAVTSREVEGRFPPYEAVIPESSELTVALPVGVFLNAVRQASVISSEESRGVAFRLANGTMTLRSQAADVGSAQVPLEIPCDTDMETRLDPRYVIEFLRTLSPDEEVEFCLNDSESPVLFRFGQHYQYVVMPLAAD